MAEADISDAVLLRCRTARAVIRTMHACLGRWTETGAVITKARLSLRLASDESTCVAHGEFFDSNGGLLEDKSVGEKELSTLVGRFPAGISEDPVQPYLPRDYVSQNEIAANCVAYLCSKIGFPRRQGGDPKIEAIAFAVEREQGGWDRYYGSFRLEGDLGSPDHLSRLDERELDDAKRCQLAGDFATDMSS